MATFDLFEGTPWSPSTCSAAASHVSRTASQARALADTTSATCGPNTLDSSENSDPAGSLLKTSLLSELEAMTGSRMTWRPQATPCRRLWSVLTILERRTDESACGLLPTPKNSDHRSGMPERYRGTQSLGGRRSNLNDAVARMMLPTPTRSDANSSGAAGYSTESGRHSGTTLTDVLVRGMLPTPTATQWKGWSPGHNRADTNDRLDYTIERQAAEAGKRGRLSPEFVEWMMGLPIGFTEIE